MRTKRGSLALGNLCWRYQYLGIAIFQGLFWEKVMDALDELPGKQKRFLVVLNRLEDPDLAGIADAPTKIFQDLISEKGLWPVKQSQGKTNRLEFFTKNLRFLKGN